MGRPWRISKIFKGPDSGVGVGYRILGKENTVYFHCKQQFMKGNKGLKSASYTQINSGLKFFRKIGLYPVDRRILMVVTKPNLEFPLGFHPACICIAAQMSLPGRGPAWLISVPLAPNTLSPKNIVCPSSLLGGKESQWWEVDFKETNLVNFEKDWLERRRTESWRSSKTLLQSSDHEILKIWT